MALQGTNGTTLKEILESVDCGETQLPDFQRGWVWEDKRIRALIASITNKYPIGAAMLLEYAGSDVRFKYRLIEGVDDSKKSTKPRYLILDGQQRITSLYRSVFSKGVVTTCDDKKKEIKRFYYLHIPSCLSTTTDRIDAVISVPEDKIIRENIGRDIKLDLSTREKEFQERMFPLNYIFSDKMVEWQMEYMIYHNYTSKIRDEWIAFYSKIIKRVTSFTIPLIILDNTVPKEAVCQVFENVNQGGVSLTVFELVTASFAAEDFQLRDDWKLIKAELEKDKVIKFRNNQPAFTGVDFLTAITLLTNYLKNTDPEKRGISCKKKDVLNLSLDDYRAYRDKLIDGVKEAVKFVKQQKIFTSVDLPYTTQLIPLSVLFAIDKNLWYPANNRAKLERWYWCGIFGELYGGANETRYVNDIVGMVKWLKDDSALPDTIVRSTFNYSRLHHLYTRNSAAYKGVMALILKNGAIDFITGGTMDFATYVEESTDIHHIFPQAYCIKAGIDRGKWNSVINKTPIYARSNRSIGGKAPSVYLQNIENENSITHEALDKYLASHLIDVDSIRRDDFDTYFDKRAKAICEQIKLLTGKDVEGIADNTIDNDVYLDEEEE